MPQNIPVLKTSEPFLERTLEVLDRGGLVISPTVTNYILICDATNEEAVRRVFEVKKRRQSGPLCVAVPRVVDIPVHAQLPEGFPLKALDALLPGEINFIFRHRNQFPRQLVSGLPTMAVTVSSDRDFGLIAREYGRPLAGTSANISGQGNIFVSLDKARRDIGDKVDLILDGGPTIAQAYAEHKDRVNTVVDFTLGRPWLVREGWVPTARLLELFPDLNTDTEAYAEQFRQRVQTAMKA